MEAIDPDSNTNKGQLVIASDHKGREAEDMAFNPKDHLINLNGKQYLQVAWRIAWMREERPDWSIETDCQYWDEKRAQFKATVKDSSGRIISQARGNETISDFRDYFEKAVPWPSQATAPSSPSTSRRVPGAWTRRWTWPIPRDPRRPPSRPSLSWRRSHLLRLL